MHNLTYQERARFAYANGNTELAEALEKCAELEAENERLTDRVWDLEQETEYVERVTKFAAGHGAICDIITLKDGRVLAMSDEYVGFYDSFDAFQYDCGDDCRAGFWIPTDRLEAAE